MDGKEPPLGSGERFKRLKAALGHKRGVTSPGGLAAYIGRRKLGKKRMAELAAAGRRRHAQESHD